MYKQVFSYPRFKKNIFRVCASALLNVRLLIVCQATLTHYPNSLLWPVAQMPNISYRLEMQAAEYINAVDGLSSLKKAGNIPRPLSQTQKKWGKIRRKKNLEVEA